MNLEYSQTIKTNNTPLSNKPPLKTTVHKIAFISILLLCFWNRIDTTIALTMGILFSLLITNPFPKHTSAWSKILLQISVVGLGFGIGIHDVINEGKHSIVYTIIGIACTLLIGNIIGRLLKVNSNISELISFGTAICGGSAIAAMAPVIKAKDDEIAVSMATVFTLNSVALILFPFIGHLLHLSEKEFGTWAALAIHDTSSVVGAAAAFGTAALAIGTTVKLTRALWITPVVLGYAFFKKSDQKAKIPLFILGFILAAVIKTVFPDFNPVWITIALGARRLLVVTLFLIGAGLSRSLLKKVGLRPMIQAVILWVIAGSATLAIICRGII